MPPKSPLRKKHWSSDDLLVVGDSIVRGLSTECHVDVCHATGSYLLKLHDAIIRQVSDDPVLSLRLLEEDTNPVVRGILIHEERMSSIALLAGWLSIVEFSCLICRPH